MVAGRGIRTLTLLVALALLAGCAAGNGETAVAPSATAQSTSTVTQPPRPTQTPTSAAPTTTLNRTDTAHALIEALYWELAPHLDTGPDGVPGLATCLVAAYVMSIGPEELAAAGLTPATIDMAEIEQLVESMSGSEQTELGLATARCGLMYTAEAMRDLGISEESIECFVFTYRLYVDDLATKALDANTLPLWLEDEAAFDDAVSEIYASCLTPEELDHLRLGFGASYDT